MSFNFTVDVDLEQAIVRDPLIVSPCSSMTEAIACMNAARRAYAAVEESESEQKLLHADARASCVLVIDGDELIGLLTERDVVRLSASGHFFANPKITDVMTRTVITLQQFEFTDIFAALKLLHQHRIHHLPVVSDQGKVLGLLTHETLRHLICPLEVLHLVDSLEQRISHLETEKMELLQNRNTVLESEVQKQTLALREQTKREQLLSAIATRIHSSLELQTILNAVVVEVQQFLKCDRVLVYQFNPDWSGQVTAESVLPGWRAASGDIITDSCFQSKANQLYAQGIKHIVPNIYEAGYPLCYVHLLEQYQVKANLVVPIMADNQLWGLLLGHQCDDIRHWETTDLDLLDRIAVQVAIAIQKSNAYAQVQREITERQQVENALRQSEATQRAILQSLPDLLIRTNIHGERLEFLSGGEVNVLHPPPGIQKPTVFDALPEAAANQQLQNIQQAIITGHLQAYEQQIEVDQQTCWEEVRITPLMNDEAIVMVRDITSRKEAEEAFQNLVEGAAAIASENFFSDLGQYIAEVLGVRGVVVVTQHDALLQSIVFWLDGQLQPNITYRITNTPYDLTIKLGHYICSSNVQQQFPDDQTLKTVDAETYAGVTLTDTNGDVIGCLYVVDSKPLTQPQLTLAMLRVFAARVSAELERQIAIDALKRLNEELEDRITRRTLELQQSKEQFRQVFEQSPVGIAISNLEGRLTRVNSSLTQIMGYDKETLLQLSIQDVLATDEQPQNIQRLHALTEQTLPVVTFELQLRSGKGEPVWVNTTSALLLNAFGHPCSIVHLIEDVSERKQAELKAESLKERLQFLLASSPVVIYTCQASGDYGVSSISENVTDLLGHKPDDFVQDHRFWSSHLHPQDRARVLSELPALFHEGHHYHEYRFLHRDGSYRWVRDELRLIYESGQPIEIIGSFADITELKQTELELQELTLSLRNAMEGISRLDQHGRYLTLNQAYAKSCGYEPKELIGTEWQTTVHPEDIPLMEAAYQTMLEQGKAEAEARGIRKDGSLFYKQVTMVLALNEEGQFDGHYCFMKDISDRKAAETALKYQLAAIEAAIDGIAVLEGETYTYVNKAHLDMFGYEQPADLIGKSWTTLYSLDEHERFVRDIFPVLMQQQHWQGEAIATRKDGSTFTEGLSLTLAESGALICVCRDVTEQKQTEIKIRQANDQLLIANAELARATRLKDEFLANMSHELRTPLNAILGMAEGLQEQVFGGINNAQVQALGTIERSGRHLLELINDILDVSKIESGTLELQIAPVSVQYLCDSSLTFVRQLAVQKNIQLTATIPENIPDLWVDERRIRQVLINLLNNAVKFTPEGGTVQLSVLHESSNGGSILFQVRDSGIGIAPENLNKLFQPFIQIDSSLTRQYTGTGLGLSLVHQLTQLHGGTVTVTSNIGEGSCFTIQLPCSGSFNQLTSSSYRSAASRFSGITTRSSNKTVLVVEDAQSAAEQTARYLAEVGLRAVVHPTGQGALEAAIQIQPALIILDILLPDLPGWEVLAQIKSHPHTQSIPVIISSVIDERSQGLSLGAFECLVKPLNRNQFYTALSSLQLGTLQSPVTPGSNPRASITTPLILLAEDNAASVATLSGYLKNRGFQVILAKDGAEAIALVQAQHPDLILLDIQIPKIDGMTVIRQLRANPTTCSIPIIALSALAIPSDRETCIEIGASEYIAKPVRLKSLVDVIYRLLSE